MIEPLKNLKDGDKDYHLFVEKFIESFKLLRNKMNYILNLMYLMIDSGLRDLPKDKYI